MCGGVNCEPKGAEVNLTKTTTVILIRGCAVNGKHRSVEFVRGLRLVAVGALALAVFALALHTKLCLYKQQSPTILLTTIKLSHDPTVADTLLIQPRQAATAPVSFSQPADSVPSITSLLYSVALWLRVAESGTIPAVNCYSAFLLFKPPPQIS